jgi:hypothetical protein
MQHFFLSNRKVWKQHIKDGGDLLPFLTLRGAGCTETAGSNRIAEKPGSVKKKTEIVPVKRLRSLGKSVLLCLLLDHEN